MLQQFINYIYHPYTLILITIIFYLIYKNLVGKKTFICKQENINELTFQFLDNYRIKNLYGCFVRIIIYFILNIGIVFMLRYYYLNTTIDISIINPYMTLNLWYMLYLLLISCCLFFYMKVLKELFFIDIIRVYLYYYSPESKFSGFIDFLFLNNFFIESILFLLSRIITYITENDDRNNKIRRGLTKNYVFEEYLYQIVKNNAYVLSILYFIRHKIILKILHNMKYLNIIIKQLPFIFVVIAVFNDIVAKQIYYVYYALMFYSIIVLIGRFKRFFRNIALGNYELHQYFYEGLYVRTVSAREYQILNNKVEKGYQMNKEEKILMRMRAKQIECMEFVPEWLNYILNDLQNDHIRMYGDRNSYKFIVLPIRRFWLICGSCIAIFIFVILEK